MKRDRLRELLQDAEEWYTLASTPPPCTFYRDTSDESEPTEGSYPLATDSRPALRDMGIDMKHIILQTLREIEDRHGAKRVKRLMDWIHQGYINRYDYRVRCEIKEDRQRLQAAIAVRYYGRDQD